MAMLHEDKGWQFTLREVARRAGVSHAAPSSTSGQGRSACRNGGTRIRQAVQGADDDEAKGARFLAGRILRAGADLCPVWNVKSGGLRLMFSGEAGKAAEVHLSERALAALGVVIELLERGQAEEVLASVMCAAKLQPARRKCMASPCWPSTVCCCAKRLVRNRWMLPLPRCLRGWRLTSRCRASS